MLLYFFLFAYSILKMCKAAHLAIVQNTTMLYIVSFNNLVPVTEVLLIYFVPTYFTILYTIYHLFLYNIVFIMLPLHSLKVYAYIWITWIITFDSQWIFYLKTIHFNLIVVLAFCIEQLFHSQFKLHLVCCIHLIAVYFQK